jgi:hypothetical protein
MIRSQFVCFDRSGKIYTYNWNVQWPPIVVSDSLGKRNEAFGAFPEDYVAYIYRHDGGGIVCDESGYTYLANVAEPCIYKYDPERKLVKRINDPPSYYRQVDKLPKAIGLQQGGHLAISKATYNKTLTRNLFLIAPNQLLLCYEQRSEYGFQIFDVDGENLTPNEILSTTNIILAQIGRAYAVEQPPADKQGNLPNPVIKVYRIVVDNK